MFQERSSGFDDIVNKDEEEEKLLNADDATDASDQQFYDAIKEEDIKLPEKEISKEIIEKPQDFLSWFEKIKNSLNEWPENFLKNTSLRKAVIYASIPFAILSATKQEVRAEDVMSGLINQPAVSDTQTNENFHEEIKADDLIAIEDEKSKEILAQKINFELNALDRLSQSFNGAIEENRGLLHKEALEKIDHGKKIFDFDQRMMLKIREAGNNFNNILTEQDPNKKEEKRSLYFKKNLKNGELSFRELAKIFPEIMAIGTVPFLYHEIAGHEKAASEQGVVGQTRYETQDARELFYCLSFLKGHTKYKNTDNVKDGSAISAAGINANKTFGEFLTNNLRGNGSALDQLLAIMALIAKSDGARYALSTNFSFESQKMKEASGNDITYYSKNTGISVSELALGLTADFLLDKDNWHLMSIALGREGVRMPETTIAPFYELGSQGPIAGIKFKGVF